ncbi:MAG TPA: aminoglycoside phosphotransferase family protein [Candidatus Binataceae bacterium]|nr:aminoglycoside phosphotransferase family protein [Candidatus Binataceae bacterium]
MIDPREINTRLSSYLGAPLESLRVLASGWETTIFEFALGAASARFREIPAGPPLVLRFYQGAQATSKGARESLTITRLSAAGFPVPRPYAFELDQSVLGAPFLVMERLDGGPLFVNHGFPEAFKTFSLGFPAFVRAQVRLHRMNPDDPGLRDIPRAYETGLTAPGTPMLDRALAIIADRVERGPLPGLRDALGRLAARAALYKISKPSLLHLDYHPRNVVVRGMHLSGVIDWVNADVGDRHLDAAMTAAILSSSALEHPRWMRDNLAGNSLRFSFASLYVPLYHAMYRLDFQRFRYCQAVAAMLRLSMMGMMRARGPESVGYRPEAMAEVTPAVMRLLSRYAERKSGAQVRVDLAAQPA